MNIESTPLNDRSLFMSKLVERKREEQDINVGGKRRFDDEADTHIADVHTRINEAVVTLVRSRRSHRGIREPIYASACRLNTLEISCAKLLPRMRAIRRWSK